MATLAVLLFLGRHEIGLKSIAGIVAFFVLFGAMISWFDLHPIIFIVAVTAADIYLILSLFGSDIKLR